MKPITDKRQRTEYKRPATVGSISVYRTGLSDIYMLTPGGTITVSVDKRSAAYTGAVVYTTDSNPGRFSTWEGASADDTSDVVDAAIPAGATGVAFVCSALTGVLAPRAPATVSVRDSNVDDNRTVHNRVRHYSGGHVSPSFTPFDPLPGFLKTAEIAFRADKLSSLWLDTARTMPALGVLDEQIHAWDNIGTLTSFQGLAENAAGDHAFYTVSGLNGLPEIRSDGVGTVMKGVPGVAFGTAGNGLSVFSILSNFTGAFATVFQFGDSASDDVAFVDGGSGPELNRNSSGALMNPSAAGGLYAFMNSLSDGTVPAGEWDFSSSNSPPGAEPARVLDFSNTAELFLFSGLTPSSVPIRASELYILNNSVSTANVAEFRAYCLSKYGLTKAV